MASVPDPAKDQAERERVIFDGWLNECAELQDLVVEQLLANLPSAQDSPSLTGS